ncbi:hypothetical protein HORIV_40540 [Vreelandella olivaria]|uniref:Cobalamin biosynthesis precorrin-8X methylmutase CobH/CbiC domain-containing protein n=1 Tax=Vreelandella olivaria TaxID=390919 RepID=A0ABM7GLN1_9GAMM|nr:hypothetical protein HORIV_40540 [Halomonas olivaria]
MPYKYETSGPAIYRQSFAIIRSEAELARFSAEEETVAVRMIHAAGLVELAAHIHFQNDVVNKARAALEQGAPILCDARMVSEGITRKRLPADNQVICTLNDERTPRSPRRWQIPARRRRWSCGARTLKAPWSPLAMRPPRFSIYSICSKTQTAHAPQRLSAAR